MHLIRLDIDRKNFTGHLQAGPFGGGSECDLCPMHDGGATMSRFVGALFSWQLVNEVFENGRG